VATKIKNPEAAPGARLLSVEQAATYLGATVWFMRKLAWGKKIAFVHLGHRLLFDVKDLDNFIMAQKVPAQG
jgi:excisionase family DNA binding protein